MHPMDDPFVGSDASWSTQLEYFESFLIQDNPDLIDNIASTSSRPTAMLRTTSSEYDEYQKQQLDVLTQRVSYMEMLVRQMVPTITQNVHRPVTIKKSVLDRFCLVLFQQTTNPTPNQLTKLAGQIEESHPGIETRPLISKIRQWFRKKREEVGLKVQSALKKIYGEKLAMMRDEILRLVNAKEFDMKGILEESKLAMTITPPVHKLCLEKLQNVLEKLKK